MNIAIRYYSQTGNTKKLAEAIAAELGVEAKDVSHPLEEKTDILFLCNSVYWAGIDKKVKRFVNTNALKIGTLVNVSTAALIDTIRTEAQMRKAAGERILLLTLGNYGEQFLSRNLAALSGREVKCSNFLGDAIDIGVSLGFEGILIVGHIGKLVKLGSGIFNTHSAYADGRMETLIACAALAGVDSAVLCRLTDCVTVDAALDILLENGCMADTLHVLTERIGQYLNKRVKSAVPIGAVVFSYQHEIWLETAQAGDLLQQLQEG